MERGGGGGLKQEVVVKGGGIMWCLRVMVEINAGRWW